MSDGRDAGYSAEYLDRIFGKFINLNYFPSGGGREDTTDCAMCNRPMTVVFCTGCCEYEYGTRMRKLCPVSWGRPDPTNHIPDQDLAFYKITILIHNLDIKF